MVKGTHYSLICFSFQSPIHEYITTQIGTLIKDVTYGSSRWARGALCSNHTLSSLQIHNTLAFKMFCFDEGQHYNFTLRNLKTKKPAKPAYFEINKTIYKRIIIVVVVVVVWEEETSSVLYSDAQGKNRMFLTVGKKVLQFLTMSPASPRVPRSPCSPLRPWKDIAIK